MSINISNEGWEKGEHIVLAKEVGRFNLSR